MKTIIKTSESNYTITIPKFKLNSKQKSKLKIKLSGLFIIAIGIVGCCIIPEDATGFLFAILLGLLVIFGKVE